MRLMIRYAWWVHPVVVFGALSGVSAAVAILAPESAYEDWRVPKLLDDATTPTLILLMSTFALAIFVSAGVAARSGSRTIEFSDPQVAFLRRALRVLLVLTVVGYAAWFASAVSQGVGVAQLAGVLGREVGAIGELKASSRPIAGVTTLTQFGPVAIAIGYLLRRLGVGSRWYLWLVPLAAVRTVFYAERLAIVEVLVPMVILAALTIDPKRRGSRIIRAAPILVIPATWGIFAASEYARSWIYYQQWTDAPFAQWVTLRLAGYYATAYNNSALYEKTFPAGAIPYYSAEGVWNSPVAESLAPYPGIDGLAAREWWDANLLANANPEFNNTGSFLVTHAELGAVGSFVMWIALGLLVGAIFSRMTQGRVPALLAVATLYVGLLELPRFIYWTQGRALPVLIALAVIAIKYPKSVDAVVAHGKRRVEGSRSRRSDLARSR